MTAVMVLIIIFGFILLSISIICGSIVMVVKVKREGISKGSRKMQNEEAGMIQSIYHGLKEMEHRIESLETIILDRGRKDHTS